MFRARNPTRPGARSPIYAGPMPSAIVALHLGGLHPYEKAVTLLLAFGPFVVLGIVVAVRRRHDLAEERAENSRAQVADTAVEDAQVVDAVVEQIAEPGPGRPEEELSERATPGRPG